MSARIIDGKQVAAALREEIARRVASLRSRASIVPGLGVILVGDDPASHSYVLAKEKACAAAGMFSDEKRLPGTVAQADVLAEVGRLNRDPRIHGILVQLPLPRQIDESAVIRAISPDKDVDGFTAENVGRLHLGEPCFLPCTPHGVIRLLLSCGIETAGRHAVVVGRSNIVGKPLSQLFLRKAPGGNATVTVCHTATRDLAAYTRQADILVAAAGRPATVRADMVKPGAAVIDVGVNRVPDPAARNGYRLVGDVDFEAVREVAGWITPVPGGVGPMTITMLLENTLTAAERAAG
jgi:methylenetetrahydrofolate dehydrogenase (NADP+)/methenyltetrahydrofolate cyclohydrolase